MDKDGRPLSPQEAFAGILLGASACDGHASQEELHALFTITDRMLLFEHISRGRWNTVVGFLTRLLAREGSRKLIDRCAEALPDSLRQTAFANACDIVLADGIVQPEERQFLDHLQKALGIDAPTALTIVEVMITKNKG